MLLREREGECPELLRFGKGDPLPHGCVAGIPLSSMWGSPPVPWQSGPVPSAQILVRGPQSHPDLESFFLTPSLRVRESVYLGFYGETEAASGTKQGPGAGRRETGRERQRGPYLHAQCVVKCPSWPERSAREFGCEDRKKQTVADHFFLNPFSPPATL